MSYKSNINGQIRGFYYAASGDDDFSGQTVEVPKLTIQSAIDEATALSPTAVNIALVTGSQGGSFSETMVLTNFVQFNGQDTTITSSSTTTVTLASGLRCQLVNATNSGSGNTFLVSGLSNVGIFSGRCAVNTGVGVNISGTVTDIFVNFSDLDVEGAGGTGISVTSTNTIPVDINIDVVQLEANNTTFIDYNAATVGSECVLRVSSVDSGSNTGTSAFVVQNGILAIESAGDIRADAVILVQSGGVLRINSTHLAGTINVESGGLLQLDAVLVDGNITVDSGGTMEATIITHSGTITNNGTINGNISGTRFGTYSGEVTTSDVLTDNFIIRGNGSSDVDIGNIFMSSDGNDLTVPGTISTPAIKNSTSGDLALSTTTGSLSLISTSGGLALISSTGGIALNCSISGNIQLLTNAQTLIQSVLPDTNPPLLLQAAGTNGATTEFFVGTRDPEGNITGDPGDTYHRVNGTSSDLFLFRGASTGTAGWDSVFSGDVFATGTPLDNQLAVWTDATTIEGTTAITYDGSTFTVNDTTVINADGGAGLTINTSGAGLIIDNSAGDSILRLRAVSNNFWDLRIPSNDEFRINFNDTTFLTIDTSGDTTLSGTLDLSDATDSYQIGGTTILFEDATLLNLSVGFGAGNSHSTGINNTAVGTNALTTSSGGEFNTAVGFEALKLSNGDDNTAIGHLAMAASTGATGNTAIGSGALEVHTIGNSNVSVGQNSLVALVLGRNNTSIGSQSGLELTSAALTGQNTFIGYNTGRGITTGVENTVIGANVTGLSPTLSNNIILADGVGDVRLQFDSAGAGTIGGALSITGDFTVDTDTLFVDESLSRVGIGTASPSQLLDVENLSGSANIIMSGAGGNVLSSIDTAYNIRYTRSSAGSTTMEFRGLPSDGTSQSLFRFGLSSGSTGPNLLVLVEANGILAQTQFASNGVSSFINRNAGKLGIGTGAPDTELHILSDDADTVAPLTIETTGANAGEFKTFVGDQNPDGIITGAGGDLYIKDSAALSNLFFNKEATTGSDWETISLIPSGVHELFSTAEYEDLGTASVITTDNTRSLQFKTTVTSATRHVISDNTSELQFIDPTENNQMIYIGTSTFITASTGGDITSRNAALIAGVAGTQLFDCVGEAVLPGIDIIEIVQSSNLAQWDLGTISRISTGESGPIVRFKDTNIISTTDPLILDDCPIVELTSCLFADTNQVGSGGPLFSIKSSAYKEGRATLSSNGGELFSGESLVRIDAGLSNDYRVQVLDSLLILRSSASIFDTSGATGTFTAVADNEISETAVTGVSDSSGVASFEVTNAPLLGGLATLSGFTTNTDYNKTGIVTSVTLDAVNVFTLVVAGGSYLDQESVVLSGNTSGATNATGVVTTSAGSVISLLITASGSGYTSGETVTLIGDVVGESSASGTITIQDLFEIDFIAFGSDEAGNYLVKGVTITATAHGLTQGTGVTLSTTDSITYDGGFLIYNIQTNSFDVPLPFDVTEAGTWSTEGLDQTDPRVNASNNPGITDSQVLAFGFTNSNSTTTSITDGTYAAINAATFEESPVTQRFKLTDTTAAIFTLTALEDFSGFLRGGLTAVKTGATADYRFAMSTNGVIPTFATANFVPIEVKTTKVSVPLLFVVDLSKGDTIQVMVAGEGTSDSLTITDLVLGIG